ncbi:MAG: cobalt transporter CbiM [Desulfatiglans sp.]|jgi:cobalt/nickel transport system permease protein|nr:cobalt transporter CbiM [Desulfatiglans sp.]
MHISEGVLSGPVLVTGLVLAVSGTAVGLKKMDYEHVPQTGVLAAAFFVVSLVRVPIGPSSVHLILNGLVGLLLGWAAFPAILVGLTLQALFFQFGGITTLGVNTVIMALPALLCYYLFGPFALKRKPVALSAAFACGFLSVFFGAILAALSLVFTEEGFLKSSLLLVLSHLPVMIIEGIITSSSVAFLRKVSPAMLRGYQE